MSHFVCADSPDDPAQRRADRGVPRTAGDVPRHPRLARQFLRHLSRRLGALRPGAAGHRALRRQPDAGPGQSDEAGGRAQGPHRARARRAERRHRRLRAAWTASRPSRIAIVSVGYADGYFRAAGHADGRPGAEAIVAGQRCPSGRISMDLIALDVTDLPEHAAKRGDYVTLIGGDIGVDELAGAMRHDRLRGADPSAGAITVFGPTDRGERTGAPRARFHPRSPRACPAKADTGLATRTCSNRFPISMAKHAPTFVCQNCGAVYTRWQGKCEACGEWNTLVEESGAARHRRRPGPRRRARAGLFALEPLAGQDAGRPAPRLRHRRARPRDRRRVRARLGAAGRRRSRHRQVDAADPGHRGAGASRPSRGLYLGRGGGGAGAAARRAARPCRRRRSSSPPRPRSRTSSRRCPRARRRAWS